jgi:membrane-associated protein
VTGLLDLFLHLDDHLAQLAIDHGRWVYLTLFAIVFCETGLVVTPFLPGDSLLFAVGALSGTGVLDFAIAAPVLFLAAVLGDTVNYWIGKWAGAQLLRRFPRLVKPHHLARTHQFFERYGGKTIVLARFVPIVRTVAPFVAGMGVMTYSRFMMFNLVGAILWVGLLVPAGYFFGSIPIVKANFELVILGIIGISVLPIVIEAWRARRSTPPSSAV